MRLSACLYGKGAISNDDFIIIIIFTITFGAMLWSTLPCSNCHFCRTFIPCYFYRYNDFMHSAEHLIYYRVVIINSGKMIALNMVFRP